MVELQKFLKMKDLFAENFENFWKDFGNFCFRNCIVDKSLKIIIKLLIRKKMQYV
jgi:hypothetical protein